MCSRGLDQLWSPGGWIDRNMTLGREGMFELIRRGSVYNISVCLWKNEGPPSWTGLDLMVEAWLSGSMLVSI